MKKNLNTQLILNAEKRQEFGKQVKGLRKNGLLPANIYGLGFEPTSITIKSLDFMNVYKSAKETGIVYIQIAKESIPTLIKSIQIHPLSNMPLHIDFRKIDLKQKIETEVPVQIVGASEAVNQLGGVLLTQHDHLTVEALPTDIPQHIDIDISKLKEIGDEYTVADLPKSDSYKVLDESDTVIVSVVAHKEESTIAETATVAPEVITEKPAEEGAEAEPSETKE